MALPKSILGPAHRRFWFLLYTSLFPNCENDQLPIINRGKIRSMLSNEKRSGRDRAKSYLPTTYDTLVTFRFVVQLCWQLFRSSSFPLSTTDSRCSTLDRTLDPPLDFHAAAISWSDFVQLFFCSSPSWQNQLLHWWQETGGESIGCAFISE